ANEGAGTIEPPRTEEHKTEETPSSLIGRFLANRRRALVLGVSALLILYGAVQFAGMLGVNDRAAEPPRPAPGQTQATEPRKMAAPAPTPVAPAAPAAIVTAPDTSRQSSVQPLFAPMPSASLIAPAPATQAPAAPSAAAIPVVAPADTTASVKAPLDIAALAAKPSELAPAPLSVDKLPA